MFLNDFIFDVVLFDITQNTTLELAIFSGCPPPFAYFYNKKYPQNGPILRAQNGQKNDEK